MFDLSKLVTFSNIGSSNALRNNRPRTQDKVGFPDTWSCDTTNIFNDKEMYSY